MTWAREIERVAAESCARILGGTTEPVDVSGGPSGRHDYDIILSDTTRIALEVTLATSSGERSSQAAKVRHKARGLKVAWLINAPRDAENVRQLVAEAPLYLNTLTDHGVHEFRSRDANTNEQVREACGRLTSLGIQMAYDWPEVEERELFFSSTDVGSTSPDAVAAVVEREVHKQDNLRKLEASDRDDKHLWVWVDRTHTGPFVMLTDHRFLPKWLPTIPAPISTIWVAGLSSDAEGKPKTLGLWRVRETWEDLTAHLSPPMASKGTNAPRA